MSLRKTPFVSGEIYHLYNRGNGKNTIFFDEMDNRRFMALLYLANSAEHFNLGDLIRRQGLNLSDVFSIDRGETLVDIGAYCLMPNHFHILVRAKEEGSVSRFMQKLATAYAMYFNERYERSGSLFEGKFKSKHVGDEPYLRWLFSYIHLNPVKLVDPEWEKSGIHDTDQTEEFMNAYGYSSYHDYMSGKKGNERPESAVLHKGSFPEHFDQIKDVREIILRFDAGRAAYL